ncbi:MAG TPA: Gfo/Idh/MocA family oxidoreductase, partial [Candidatus Hydrogenedentes bacterium]|nr:Gfo/Idh/MocA family oxidoreductase [Candidatus Hydrogenedentota bacterium]
MDSNSIRASRRCFLKSATGAVAAFTIVPRHVLGQGQIPPSERPNVAGIGAGGMGGGDIETVAGCGANIVALCDVDLRRASTIRKYPGAKVYRDFRKMLDEMDKQIDAVIV